MIPNMLLKMREKKGVIQNRLQIKNTVVVRRREGAEGRDG